MSKKKRATISRSEALRRMDEILPLLDENVHVAMAVEAALDAANDIVKSRPRTEGYTGHTYHTVAQSMAMWLAITLARIYDIGPRPKNKQDKASIPLLVHLLTQRRCQSVLKKRARQWTPDLAIDQEQACARAIVGAISAYAGLTGTRAGRDALSRLKHFRDRRLAHTLRKEIEALPRYEDLFLLVDTAWRVFKHAQLAIAGRASNFDIQKEEYRRQADAFWQSALNAAFAEEHRGPPR